MTEEIDSIAPVGAQAPLGIAGVHDLLPPVAPPPTVARPQSREAPSQMQSAAVPQSGAAPAPVQISASDSLDESVKRINARLVSVNRVLQLRVDASTGITIAEIRNSATGQVLQQIPGKDVVHLAAMLSGWAHGKNVLVDLIA